MVLVEPMMLTLMISYRRSLAIWGRDPPQGRRAAPSRPSKEWQKLEVSTYKSKNKWNQIKGNSKVKTVSKLMLMNWSECCRMVGKDEIREGKEFKKKLSIFPVAVQRKTLKTRALFSQLAWNIFKQYPEPAITMLKNIQKWKSLEKWKKKVRDLSRKNKRLSGNKFRAFWLENKITLNHLPAKIEEEKSCKQLRRCLQAKCRSFGSLLFLGK